MSRILNFIAKYDENLTIAQLKEAIKFRELEIGQTFYKIGDYCKIDQYEKISDGYGLEILTNASKWFDDDNDVYVD